MTRKIGVLSLTSILLKYPVCKAVILHSASKECLVRGVSGDYYYTILYTQPDSPASEMGLKRGDHIFMVDSQKITSSNYTEYFQRPSKTYRYQVQE